MKIPHELALEIRALMKQSTLCKPDCPICGGSGVVTCLNDDSLPIRQRCPRLPVEIRMEDWKP